MGVTALVLGFTPLGCLGVHRFMMGNKNAGLISIGATVATLGAARVVFNAISIVEGVKYLRMTDEEFHQTYTVERKQWL